MSRFEVWASGAVGMMLVGFATGDWWTVAVLIAGSATGLFGHWLTGR